MLVLDWAWLTPNKLTFFSLITGLAASVFIVMGGYTPFVIAACLINISHILDCMDGQLAKYSGVSSTFAIYFYKLRDQIVFFFWLTDIPYSLYLQTN